MKLFCAFVGSCASVILCVARAPAQSIRRGEMEVRAVGRAGGYLGFDLVVGGHVIAPVRLSSNELITAREAAVAGERLRLHGLQAKAGTGLRLGEEDFVEVEFTEGDPYPRVDFRLSLAEFDAEQWQAGAGKCPFHFLTCSMPGAECLNQRGWTEATPKADPFPMLLDVHVGTPELASTWSRNWHNTVPIGAFPIPVTGLWSPADKLFVGYDFQEARLTDHSERYVAASYVWEQGDDRQFITLAYPYAGRGFQTLTFPEPGATVASHFRLVYSTQMPDTADPNEMLQRYYFRQYRDLLPSVPRMNDMTWMAGGVRLGSWPAPPSLSLLAPSPEGGTFVDPGTVEIGGWGFDTESAVDAAYRRADRWRTGLTSILSASGGGTQYGDAAALLQIPDGPAEGGKVLFVWFRLLSEPGLGQQLLKDAFAYIEGAARQGGGDPWSRVAILPFQPGGPALDYARQAGWAGRMAALTPQQLVDAKAFNARRFPVALYLGFEGYIDTVNRGGDVLGALARHLNEGGLLALLGYGPYPMYAATGPEGTRPSPFLPMIGLPVNMCFEEPPAGVRLVMTGNREQKVMPDIPAQAAFPTTGDLRLRTVSANPARDLDQLRTQLDYLMQHAKHVEAGGEPCVFWEKPIEGKWRDDWGGEPVRTLHNTNGWAAGIALVDLYRHEKQKEYLPIIDGVYNWTRHFVWTRNEFADVPSSPFAIGCTLSTAFLMHYHFTFMDDPERKEKAAEAVDLARAILYRYMAIWPSDNDPDDNLDSSYLMEPNSGRDWTGAACANEVHWVITTLTQVYVNEGDPILEHYLRGLLQRWYLLYKDLYHPSLADYGGGDMSEWLGFFDGTMAGRGGRATFGSGGILPLNYPIGESAVRVVCGEKAAFACNKNGVHTFVRDYRYSPVANFSFSLESRLTGPFDASVSFPFVDIGDKPVSIVRGGQRRTLSAPEEFERPFNSPSSVYVRGLRDGDVVVVGNVPAGAQVLDTPMVLPYQPLNDRDRRVGGFQMAKIDYDEALSRDWNASTSWAGLLAGKQWAYGVPYYLPPAELTEGKTATAKDARLSLPEGTRTLYVLFGPSKGYEGAGVQVSFGDAQPTAVAPNDCALAWESWPPCFDRRLLLARIAAPAGQTTATVTPRGAYVFAATSFAGSPQEDERLRALFDGGRAAWLPQLAFETEVIPALRSMAARLPAGKVAGIPPGFDQGAAVRKLLTIGRFDEKIAELSPTQFVNPEVFNAGRFPVAMYLDAEAYLRTVSVEGDGAEAVRRYLGEGGTLLLLGQGPYPMYYPMKDGEPDTSSREHLLPALGVPLRVVFEAPPAGTALSIRRNAGVQWLSDLPPDVPFPVTGDLRLRALMPGDVPAGETVTPLFTVVGDDGKDYGMAAVLVEHTAGELKGGRILYVWGPLLDGQTVPGLLQAILGWVTEHVGGAPQ